MLIKVNEKSRDACRTLGNVLKAGLCVSTKNGISYAKGHNAAKYNWYMERNSTTQWHTTYNPTFNLRSNVTNKIKQTVTKIILSIWICRIQNKGQTK